MRLGTDRWQRLLWMGDRLARFSYGADSKRLAAALEWSGEGELAQIGEAAVAASLGLGDPGWPSPPGHPILSRIPREVQNLRLVRVLWPYEALLCSVLQQRVSWEEASGNWRDLCWRYGEQWGDQRSAPSPTRLLTLSYDQLAEIGIESSRAAACKEAARVLQPGLSAAADLERLAQKLLGCRGMGPWTVDAFLGMACGAADAVPLGDYSLPQMVHYVFTGERHGTDELMLQHLAPFAGQRFRVIRWFWSAGYQMPRRGPRLPTGRGIGRGSSRTQG